MTSVCLRSIVFASLLTTSFQALQAQDRPAPTFALSIAEKPLEAFNAPGTHLILVTYTNISNVPQMDYCVVTPVAYDILVRYNGLPLEKRKSKKTTEEQPSENDGRPRIHVYVTEQDGCRGVGYSIDPGESVKFTLWATAMYDMSQPGTYQVTVTRDINRLIPNKAPVIVSSNTITIIVPDANQP
jgi:hypothetical protein